MKALLGIRRRAARALLFAVLIAGGQKPLNLFWDNGAERPRSRMLLMTFTEHGVRVDVAIEKHVSADAVLAVTYTPIQLGFHLYSKDLPSDGIHGAGRPTRLTLIPEENRYVGEPAFTDSALIDYHLIGFDQPFPVYPDGPVTLYLPLKISGNERRMLHPVVTYMACGNGRCLPPVVDKPLEVQILD